MHENIVRFSGFEYRIDEHCLSYAGKRLPVGSRALALLRTLLAQPGTYIPAGELMRAAWPETHVDEGNLRVQLTALRRQLSVCGRPLIQNAPGRGYAFVGSVEELGAGQSATKAGALAVEIRITFWRKSGVEFSVSEIAPALRTALQMIEAEPETVHAEGCRGDLSE
jgi:DNA-binding winged helix-turn-helix (wHTH) protein